MEDNRENSEDKPVSLLLTAQEANKVLADNGFISKRGYIFHKDGYFADGTYPGCMRGGLNNITVNWRWEEITEREIVCKCGYESDMFVAVKADGSIESFIDLYDYILRNAKDYEDIKNPMINSKLCREYFKKKESEHTMEENKSTQETLKVGTRVISLNEYVKGMMGKTITKVLADGTVGVEFDVPHDWFHGCEDTANNEPLGKVKHCLWLDPEELDVVTEEDNMEEHKEEEVEITETAKSETDSKFGPPKVGFLREITISIGGHKVLDNSYVIPGEIIEISDKAITAMYEMEDVLNESIFPLAEVDILMGMVGTFKSIMKDYEVGEDLYDLKIIMPNVPEEEEEKEDTSCDSFCKNECMGYGPGCESECKGGADCGCMGIVG